MTQHASNPAGRLWLFYMNLFHMQENKPVQPFAATYFGIEPGVTDRYLIAVAELMKLPDRVEEEVRKLRNPVLPVEKLLSPLGPVRRSLTSDPLGSQAVAWHKQIVNATMMSELETTSYFLASDQSAEPVLGPETIDKIRDLAEQIIQLATEADDIDADARAVFVQHGYRIKEAVDMYKVAGVQPLVNELDRFHQRLRRTEKPSGALWARVKELTGVIVVALELFIMPVDVAHAIDVYTDAFSLPAITQAPGPQDDVLDAEVVEDDDSVA